MSTQLRPVFIDNASSLGNGRFFREREREKKRSKNVSAVQERNIYAGYVETLMQSHSDSGITHVYQGHESHVRPASKLTESYAFTAGVTCRGASRPEHCMCGQSLEIRVSYLREKNRNVLLIGEAPAGSR